MGSPSLLIASKKEQILALPWRESGFELPGTEWSGFPTDRESREWLESAMSSSQGKMFLIQASIRFYMTPNMPKNTRLLAFMAKGSRPAITAGKT
jgi:hypothetical protein